MGLVAVKAMFREIIAKFQEVAEMGETNFAVLGDLQEEVWAVKKPVAELLPSTKNFRGVRLNTVERMRSSKIESSRLKDKEAPFDWATIAVNNQLLLAIVECATLGWYQDEVLQ